MNSNTQAAIAQASTFVNGELTEAERLTVKLLVREGLSNAEIAARRFVSVRTIENQIRTASDKAKAYWGLNVASRTQLVILLSLYYAVLDQKDA